VFCCIGGIIIESVLCIDCCSDDSTILINFVEVRRCEFPFFCERAYDLECGLKR
jgi:hypothetical protein